MQGEKALPECLSPASSLDEIAEWKCTNFTDLDDGTRELPLRLHWKAVHWIPPVRKSELSQCKPDLLFDDLREVSPPGWIFQRVPHRSGGEKAAHFL